MIKVNLGCGSDYREGYVNVDFSNTDSSGNGIKVDKICNFLTEELPFDDGSVSEVSFIEVLEHTNRFDGLRVLKKIYKCMSKDGVLNLTVPNAARQMKLLLTKMDKIVTFDDFENAHERWHFWKFQDDLAGGTSESDGTDGNSHKTFYSVSALFSVLEHVGFKVEDFTVDSSIRVKATK